MTRTRSVQFAQKFGKIAVARLARRRLEGATQRGRDSGVGEGNVDPDNPSISCVNVHGRKFFLLRFH